MRDLKVCCLSFLNLFVFIQKWQ